jgi:hypothetical protein
LEWLSKLVALLASLAWGQTRERERMSPPPPRNYCRRAQNEWQFTRGECQKQTDEPLLSTRFLQNIAGKKTYNLEHKVLNHINSSFFSFVQKQKEKKMYLTAEVGFQVAQKARNFLPTRAHYMK